MKSFTYTITDPVGIHARPAGLLVKAAKEFPKTDILLIKDDNTIKCTQMIKLMGMGIKAGDTVTISVDGLQEDEALAAMQKFFQENL